MKTEKKFIDGVLTDSDVVASGQVLTNTSAATPIANTGSIVGIVQGVGEQQRIGRKCTITNINLRLNLHFISNTTGDGFTAVGEAHESIRFIIYWDKQCNGAVASVAELLEGAGTDFDLYREMSNLGRFKFLYDRIWVLNASAVAMGNGTANDSTVIVKDYIKKISLKTFIPIEFNGATGGLTEIKSNNVGMLIWSKHGGRVSVQASNMRIRFIDY